MTSQTTAVSVQLAQSISNNPVTTSVYLASASTTPISSSQATTNLDQCNTNGTQEENEDVIEQETGLKLPSSSVRNVPGLLCLGRDGGVISYKVTADVNSNSPEVVGSTSDSLSAGGPIAFDKNPLWFQNSAVSASSEHQPIFAPRSLTPPSAGISLAPKLGGNLILQNTLAAASSASTTTSGANAVTPSLAVRPSLMYQLMSPPCVPRPLLAPILTVLPHTSGLVPSNAMLLDNLATAHSQSLAVEALINKSAQETEKAQSDSSSDEVFTKSVKRVMAEPATGQAILPQDFSLVSSSSTFNPPHPHTLASIPHSELTPQHLELKAFAEDFKTRRIRLGYTQGTVGQSLAERGYSNFAQSTISRFEQMQLSPSNAATIRIILEKWLLEAESPQPAPNSTTNNASQMAGRKRKKRAVFAPKTKSILDEFFTQNRRPNRQAIESISQKLDLLPEEVRVWFCNKRQKSKPHSTSGGWTSSYEQDSPLSSVAPSPTLSEGSGMNHIIGKGRSPSPPKMPFTIEELSKSSSTSNSSISSFHLSTAPTSARMGGMTRAIQQSTTTLPILFNSNTKVFSNPILPQFISPTHVAQTRA